MSIINTALIGKLKKTKADKSNVLELDNLTSFTPSSDYHPATKKYVDDAVLGLSPDTNTYLASGTVSGNNLKLTLNDASTVDIDVSSLLDNTDTLTNLSLSGNTLTYIDELGNDTNIDLSAYLDNTDTYVSSGSVTGNTLRLTMSDTSFVDVDVSAISGGSSGGFYINNRKTEDFTATAGQTVFNVSIGLDDIEVFYNGIKLDNEDYTVNTLDGTVTLLEATEADDNIEVINYGEIAIIDYNYNKTAYTVGTSVNGYDGNLNTFPATYIPDLVDVYLNGLKLTNDEFTATNGTSIILDADATSGDYIEIIGNLPVTTNDYYSKTEIDDLIGIQVNEETVNTGFIEERVIDTLAMADIRSAEYTITCSSDDGFMNCKVAVLHDNQNAYSTTFAIIGPADMGDFDARVNGSNVELVYTPRDSNIEVKFIKTTISNSNTYDDTLVLTDGDLVGGDSVIDLTQGNDSIDLKSQLISIDLENGDTASSDLNEGDSVIDLND